MALPIISAEQRLKEKRGVKAVIFGKSGIGKTSLLKTLPEDKTLFIDLEAGDLAVEDWSGDTIRPNSWTSFRDLTLFLAGPNKTLKATEAFSQERYVSVKAKYGNPESLEKYDTIFIDSITVLARLCFQWCKDQPECISERTGKPDLRSAYGLHGQEMIKTLTHLQHSRTKNIIFVGILDEKTDEFGRLVYSPQLEGSKTGLELPGIVDQVITMAEIKSKDSKSYRAFVNHAINPKGFPAKDRSGRLALYEPPHLGKLITKICQAKKSNVMQYDLPTTQKEKVHA